MKRELKNKEFWRSVLAELVGMTVFIFLGISAAIGNSTGPDQEVKVSLTFGLAIATLAQCLGHISGAHLNPAITVAMLACSQISVIKAAMFIATQMLAATVASGIVLGVRPVNVTGLAVNNLNDISASQGVAIEFIITFQLVLCVIAMTDKRRCDAVGSAPLAIGLSVCLGHLAAIPYTGCGMNPARSFGPAVILGAFKNHWIYWVGPMSGGVVAALLHDFLLYPKPSELSERVKALLGGPGGVYDIFGQKDTTDMKSNLTPEDTKLELSICHLRTETFQLNQPLEKSV